jgi:hypothetical protein
LGTLYLERVKEESVELCTSSCINMAEIIMDLYFDLGRYVPLARPFPFNTFLTTFILSTRWNAGTTWWRRC